MKKLSTDEFIRKAKQVHGDKYDYSKVEYVNNSTKVCIVCPIHGEFWQKPNNHLNNHGCKDCMKENNASLHKMTTSDFVEKAKLVHGDKYDYSKTIYNGINKKVCIVCSKHGEFWQKANDHINNKCGCPKCVNKNKTTQDFINKAQEIHGNKYDYSKVNYVNAKTKVCIICSKHREFWQTPVNHLQGNGCIKCGYSNNSINKSNTTDNFIDKAKEIHGDKYDYSKVEYKNNRTKIAIICQEHGVFFQTPNAHLNKQGCPKCNNYKLEQNLILFFKEHNIKYIYQARFEWLGKQSLDFYLTDYKIGIECQGIQHFIPIQHFGGENEFIIIQKRDSRKKQLCDENGIKLLYYAEKQFTNSPYKLFIDENDLLKEIVENET